MSIFSKTGLLFGTSENYGTGNWSWFRTTDGGNSLALTDAFSDGNSSGSVPYDRSESSTTPGVGTYYSTTEVVRNLKTKIPVGSFVKGLEVHAWMAGSDLSFTDCYDYLTKLYKGSDPIGDDKAAGTKLSGHFTVTQINYGGSDDLWGLADNFIPDSYVNNADFGVAKQIQMSVVTSASNIGAYHNELNIDIHYNPTGMFMSI